jgi:predicted DNA-binding transcriptional regulator AlpA
MDAGTQTVCSGFPLFSSVWECLVARSTQKWRRPHFPQRYRISARCSAWGESDDEIWQHSLFPAQRPWLALQATGSLGQFGAV